MTFSMKESFEWVIPEFKTAAHASDRKINIRGRALFADAVSANARHYVEEEVSKAARTLVGKPITINHDPSRIVGHVVFAEESDGDLEYVGEINNEDYVWKLQDKFALTPEAYETKYDELPISGVSVEADYLYNRCPECGEYFQKLDEFTDHMHDTHDVFPLEFTEPRGMMMTALSLVEPPETPGISDTTMELWETASGMSRLLETVTHTYEQTKIKEQNILNQSGIALHSDAHIAFGKSTISEQDEPEPCPEGQHRNEDGECVPDVVAEQDEDCPEGQHRNDDGECVPDVAEQDEACPEGQHRNDAGECIPDVTEQEECPEGQHRDENGECVPDITEQEECPEGQHRNEDGECVPDAVTEQETPSCPEGQHRDPLTGECVDNTPLQEQEEVPPFAVTCPDGQHLDPATNTCVPDNLKPITVEPPVPEVPAALETLSLGEPFADYDSFEDCVAKNSEKDDPAGYCADLKGKTEETTNVPLGAELQRDTSTNPIPLRYRRMMEKRELDHTHQHEDIAGEFKKLGESLNCNNATFTAVKTGIQSLRKQQQRIGAKLNEVIKTRHIPKPVDFTPILSALNETRSTLNKQIIDLARNGAVIQKTTTTAIRTTNNQLKVFESALKNHLAKIQTLTKSTATLPTLHKGINTLTDVTKQLPSLESQITALTEQLDSVNSTATDAITALTSQIESFNTVSTEAVTALTGKIEAFSIASTEAVTNLTAKVEAQGKEYEKFKEVVSSEYEQVKTDNDAKLAEKDSTIDELKGKLKDAAKKTVKETEDLTTKVENLTEMMKSMPQFKGTQKNVVTESEPAATLKGTEGA